MHIICPHCTTSYVIDLATLGLAGRSVRCSRCKEVWLARPEDAIAVEIPSFEMAATAEAATGDDDAAEWDALARAEESQEDTPVVDSPSISGDGLPEGEDFPQAQVDDGPSFARNAKGKKAGRRGPLSWFAALLKPRSLHRAQSKPLASLPTACAGMGALALALMIWRVDVVRLLPQTAAFYQMVGMDVNLRGLSFKDVKVTTETAAGEPVLVIEGVITGQARKPIELPRLRFSVRDAQGTEIYAWNTVLEQPVLNPQEKAWFKSRLASPPPEGRQIDVRFFNKRDLAGGHT
jgi:predicted Zn finger-like uncharacterized protein